MKIAFRQITNGGELPPTTRSVGLNHSQIPNEDSLFFPFGKTRQARGGIGRIWLDKNLKKVLRARFQAGTPGQRLPAEIFPDWTPRRRFPDGTPGRFALT
jgi:hypothetical protein